MFSKVKTLMVALLMALSASAVIPAQPAQAGVLIAYLGVATCNYNCETAALPGVFFGFTGGAVALVGLGVGAFTNNWVTAIVGGGLILLPAQSDAIESTLQKNFPELAASEISSLAELARSKTQSGDFKIVKASADHSRGVLEVCLSPDEVTQALAAGDYTPMQIDQLVTDLGCR